MDERMKDIEKFALYLARRSPQRRTAIDYVSDIRQFAALCDRPWREVSLQDIDAFVDQQRQKGLSPATIKRRVSALKVFFDFLAEEAADLSWPNPVRFKRHAGKPPKRLPRDLTQAQVEQLWALIERPRDRAWFVLMLRAGLRVAEVTGLRLTDLLTPPETDHPARLRVLGKGQKERLVLLSADAYDVLQEWLKHRPATQTEAVFVNEQGQPLSTNGLQWLLRGYSQAAGVKATPHQLRHTFARQLRQEGMPLPSLSKLLGHTQISTTEIYTAGADPHLAQAYQTAMGQLAQLPPPPPLQPASPALTPSPTPPPPPLPVAPPPDWTKWAPDLPPAIRQACLAFVQRRLTRWKPQRQRVHAQRTLGHLSRFWRWQLAHRPLNQPGELHLADLQAFQQAQLQAGLAASTINSHIDDLLASLRDLAQQDQPIDPALFRLRYLPRPQSLPRHLSDIQSQSLERYLHARLTQADPLVRLENACFFILAHTGLRASECLDLLGQDLDLAGQRLIVRQGKGQRDRVVYLSSSACQALQAYLADMPLQPTLPLLRLPSGQPISYSWLYTHLTQVGQAAGQIKVTPHQLRHTLATRLLNVGMPVTAIQKLLGHDNLNTTMIYARVLEETVQAEYQRAMNQIEGQQMPFSRTPELVPGWPVPQPLEPSPTQVDNFA